MAFLIPENIPSRSGAPDRLRQVARALRDFTPGQTTVWLKEKEVGTPYLEILDPSAGILLIEAPLITTTKRRTRRRWRPFAPQDIVSIREDIMERAEHLRKGIDRALVRSLPVECVLAAPYHDAVPVDALDPLQAGLPILTRPDLTETGMAPAIRRILGAAVPPPLSEQEENRVRAEINPGSSSIPT